MRSSPTPRRLVVALALGLMGCRGPRLAAMPVAVEALPGGGQTYALGECDARSAQAAQADYFYTESRGIPELFVLSGERPLMLDHHWREGDVDHFAMIIERRLALVWSFGGRPTLTFHRRFKTRFADGSFRVEGQGKPVECPLIKKASSRS